MDSDFTVSLRNFTADDSVFVADKMYPCLPPGEVEKMICDWNKKTYKGSYFEMFAILYGQTPAGKISLYDQGGAISAGPEVLEAYRQKGIGYQALRLALEYAKERGYTKAVAQVRKNNAASIRLHEKHGFTITGDCVTSRGNEAWLFEKDLL